MRNYGSSRTEKFEDFLEDKKADRIQFMEKNRVVKSAQKKLAEKM